MTHLFRIYRLIIGMLLPIPAILHIARQGRMMDVVTEVQ
jgi:hypothetical protein